MTAVPTASPAASPAAQPETAILAGGCFWGVQELIRHLPGVLATRVGYSGGDVPHATYRHHGTHAEAIEIVFDPARLSYRALLEFFFQIHDPTTPDRQGNDRGTPTARPSTGSARRSARRPSAPWRMSTPADAGPARSSPS